MLRIAARQSIGYWQENFEAAMRVPQNFRCRVFEK